MTTRFTTMLDPEFARDPYPMLAELRASEPIVWDPVVEAWLVTRHEDVKRIFADPRLSRDRKLTKHYRPPAPGTWAARLDHNPMSSGDEELHRAARERGLEVMVGCMVGTSLGMAPAMLLTDEARFVDLASSSARRKSGTVGKRSAGVGLRALVNASSSCGGTAGRARLGLAALDKSLRAWIPRAEEAANGTDPVSIS